MKNMVAYSLGPKSVEMLGGENHETFEQKQQEFGFNNIGLLDF